MYKLAIGIGFGLLLFCDEAMAVCSSYPYTLTNGTTADATQVMADFNCAALTQGAILDSASFTSATNFGAPIALNRTSTASAAGINFKTAGANNWAVALDPAFGVAGDLSFYDSGASAAGLILKHSGAVGIGTNTPSGSFEVRKDQNATTNFYFSNNDATNSNTRAAINLVGGTRSLSFVSVQSDHEYVNYTNGTNLYFSEGPNTRLILLSGGNVGIATTSPSYTLHVNGSVAGTSAYNNLSDARLKKNVVPLTSGLALVGQLQPVRFEWRSVSERVVGKDIDLPAEKQIGFIAQDLKAALPEAVSTAKGKDAIMSVAESKVVPILVAAVKELKAANDNQAAENARLESQIAALQRKLGVQASRN